ncbi:catalase family peroxidase [Pedomonas mirosovicensis]|uniref:catalase family peroxidase n=1 Tax=Pedomonas mirosovicensis TaxID=2908641 RepID=UPI002167B902|nr:catalase family peroxidase [Pedomonas mirosovicensis]MCH8686405.1 catalase family peroxidase [Pedomonas mirosovicensis]
MPLPRPLPLAPAALIGAIALLLAGAFAWAAGWIGARRIDGGDVIASLDYNGGKHPGYRRAHAKGLCFSGSFHANGAGSALSSASALRAGEYPVIGRFSVAGGNPLATDGRNVFHSMALLLRTPDGQEWRMAMDHTPIFPVADIASFIALQRATKPDPRTGKPDPALMKPFLAAHPEVKAFQDYMARATLPDSFANATYYSINAFRFTAKGQTRLVRWQFDPEAPLSGLDKKDLDALPRDYLFREIIARTAKGSSRWHLKLVVANPGDITDNATVAWTGPHRTIDAGILTLTAVQPEEAGACRDLNFDPTILPPGIGLSDDPMLAARSKAYSSSFTRRAGEGAGPSAAGADFSKEAEQ